MAVNYATLFQDIGQFARIANQLRDLGTGLNSARPALPQLQNSTVDTLAANNTERIGEGFHQLMETIASVNSGYAESIAAYITSRISDRATILNEIASTRSENIPDILYELGRDMTDKSESINRSVVTVNTPTKDTGNIGNGDCIVTKKLDGWSPPADGMAPNLEYKGVNSELVTPIDTIQLTCIQDADNDGLPEGHEVFLLEGTVGTEGPFDWRTEGSGASRQISTDNAHGILENRNFENFSADNSPVGWNIALGAPGQDIIAENGASNVFRGNSCLKLSNTTGDVLLHQSILPGLMDPNRLYLISLRIKTTSATAGNLELRLKSPKGNIIFPGTDQITQNLNVGTLPYFPAFAYVMMPSKIPDDLRFEIALDSFAGTDLWIDSLALAPVTYVGGVGYNILAGSTAFNRSDRFNAQHVNIEGKFQSIFRRLYGVQLPSSLTPTISDSLVA